jgi:hypothetical protein
LKPEWWGSPLAQEEKYQGKKENNNLYVPRKDGGKGMMQIE